MVEKARVPVTRLSGVLPLGVLLLLPSRHIVLCMLKSQTSLKNKIDLKIIRNQTTLWK